MNVTMPDGTVITDVPEGTTKAQIQAKYAAHMGAAKVDPFAEQIKQELKQSGGYLENVGAGANSVWQGAKQLVGQGSETDAQIEERRKLDEQLAEGRTGGGLTQIAGQMLATAPLSMATGGLGTIATKIPALARIAGAGGKIFNVGNVARGAVEGGANAALSSTTDDESRGLNTLEGVATGAALPGVLAVLAKTGRIMLPGAKYVANRAYNSIAGKLPAGEMDRIGAHLADPANATRLPLSVGARTENTGVSQLERGARARNPVGGDIGYTADKNVATGANQWLQDATQTANELGPRLDSREAAIQALRNEAENVPFNATKMYNGQTMASDAIDQIRLHPKVQLDPSTSKELANIQTVITQPNVTGTHFEAAAAKVADLKNTVSDAQAKSMLANLEADILNAGDLATNNKVTPIKLIHQTESDSVNQA